MNIDAKLQSLEQEYNDLATKKQEIHAKMVSLKRKMGQLSTVRKHAESIFVEEVKEEAKSEN